MVFLMTFLLGLVTPAKVSAVQAVDLTDGQLVEKVPYSVPFETYEAWMTFLSGRLKQRFPEMTAEAIEARYPVERFESFKKGEPLQCFRIAYMSDGLKVRGFLIEPSGAVKPRPVVIFNRGGNRDFGKLSFGTLFMLHEIASWGYVVLASQYRGNDGGEGTEAFGGADVNDVGNLISLAKTLESADAARIGMYGWSRGGMMTFLALKQFKGISAAIIGAGETDLVASIGKRPDMEKYVYRELIPDYDVNKMAALKERSAIQWVDALPKEVPLLLLHGSGDKRVSPAGVLAMAEKLYEHKHPFRMVFFEGGNHGLFFEKQEVNQQVRRWLDTYVRDQTPPPGLESVDD